jgi:chromosomal replication initiation ATPase DnaA
MREATELASKLERVLGAALWSGSEVTSTRYESGYSTDIKYQTLQEILKQLATDLNTRSTEASGGARNDATAADRRLIMTLANRFHAHLGDEHRPAIRGIVRALGINLDPKAITSAINQAPRLGG